MPVKVVHDTNIWISILDSKRVDDATALPADDATALPAYEMLTELYGQQR